LKKFPGYSVIKDWLSFTTSFSSSNLL
jgi:hypothetical protein